MSENVSKKHLSQILKNKEKLAECGVWRMLVNLIRF